MQVVSRMCRMNKKTVPEGEKYLSNGIVQLARFDLVTIVKGSNHCYWMLYYYRDNSRFDVGQILYNHDFSAERDQNIAE